MSEITVRVDASKLTFEMFVALQEAMETGRMREVMRILDQIVDGGVGHLPVSALRTIVNAIAAEITNPNSSSGS